MSLNDLVRVGIACQLFVVALAFHDARADVLTERDHHDHSVLNRDAVSGQDQVSPTHPASSHADEAPEARQSGSLPTWQIIVLVWGIVVLIGMLFGLNGTITVFRNYNDLALVFFIGFLLTAGVYVVVLLSGGKDTAAFSWITFMIFLLIAAGLLLTIVYRTWQDNPGIIKFIFAFITKISLAALFLINLVDLLSPNGKNQAQRAANKRSSLVFLLILTPLIYKLVRDKVGIWAPKDVLNKYQRGRLRV